MIGRAASQPPVGGGDERASAPTWRKDGHCDHARAQAREEGDDEAQARFEHEQRAVAPGERTPSSAFALHEPRCERARRPADVTVSRASPAARRGRQAT